MYYLKVRCFARHDDGNASSVLTKDQQTTFTGLRQRTEYGFQVRAKTTHGWGEFSQTLFKTTGQVMGTGEAVMCLIISNTENWREFEKE